MTDGSFTWNHRVLRHGDGCLQLCEVCYNEAGVPYMYSQDVCLVGDDIEELRETVTFLMDALTKPILDADVIDKEPMPY